MKTLGVLGGVSVALLVVLAGCGEDDDAGAVEAGGSCSEARESLLKPVPSVSTGVVAVLSEEDGVKTVYVDASAGGAPNAATNPRVYLDLAALARAPVTDVTAASSTAWDLALKRPIIFTNGGDGGSGEGGAVFLADVDFASVTTATAASATLAREDFFDDACTPNLDATKAVRTTFDGWYDYDVATNTLKPFPGTWIVKGGTGALFKVQILSYYAAADGGTGVAGAFYTLKVGAL
ncbi:MAG: hypothetical protein JWP97_1928 [Labilithrix sp.]|nr:hypothetical protein [Labilithrix sp.]